ncbi:NIPSNAP family protein [Micromonospora musae]|uniref:NIPSNAP family protein n=1 Tax=Micromonospora musae TaxID=1894970 RepID=UPI00341AC8DD
MESQEESGMAVLGQFRDLDRPDQFVWLRGFPDMPSRRTSLAAFYSGPVWARHAAAANATILDSDDVLLLRELVAVPVFDRGTDDSETVLHATIWYWAGPFPDPTPNPEEAVAVLRTEYAVNDFPRLPVREKEHALVWFTRSPLPADVPAGVRPAGSVHGCDLRRLSVTGCRQLPSPRPVAVSAAVCADQSP